MATFRVGVGSFNIKDGAVGIGTELSGFGNLKVEGTVKSDQFDVIESGVSTFTRYSGFSANKVEIKNRSTTLSGENQILSDVVVDNSTFTVGLGSTASIGEIGYACVKHHFSVPTGDTNFRNDVSGYSEGTIRYNTDFQTMEFFNGNEWRQFTYISDIQNSPSSRGRAIISTGYDAVGNYGGKYDFISINTLGNSLYFGDQITAVRDKIGCGSEVRALFGGGGSPTYQDEIDYLTIASEGDGIDFGDLTAANIHNSALSSSTRGIWGGGYAPSLTNTIEYVEISTIGNALDFGDLSGDMSSGSGYVGSCASPVRGMFAGGSNPSSPAGDNVIRSVENITIASKGNSVKFGDLFAKHQRPTATSNGIIGLIFSGGDIAAISEINMSSDGNAIHFGDLAIPRYSGFSSCNKVRALHGGGEPGSGGRTNSIEFVTISTAGNAQDFGDLSFAMSFLTATSDCHGGLGGY